VAGCATPSGSAGHAGETANLKLTFHLDHSVGADHLVVVKTGLYLTPVCTENSDSDVVVMQSAEKSM
jgi:hypothetical protein